MCSLELRTYSDTMKAQEALFQRCTISSPFVMYKNIAVVYSFTMPRQIAYRFLRKGMHLLHHGHMHRIQTVC